MSEAFFEPDRPRITVNMRVFQFKHMLLACLLSASSQFAYPAIVNAQMSCQHQVLGTANPPDSGVLEIINPASGTVIAANFFNSGAISNPTDESVSLCVHGQAHTGPGLATIFTDVGLDDNTQIKAYPEFIVGSKFGNQWETSFRYYDNSNLGARDQWPVTSENGFNFANLEYVAKQIGLPAYSNDLPGISITIDMDETNVIGSNRDVMLESWFFDSSKNGSIIGNNLATSNPIAGSLNNIIGIGNPYWPELDNMLLEMMVHIGALSPNDISSSNRNPGQQSLTEFPLSDSDSDLDCINDAVDVDITGGLDLNGDGVDDSKIAPVQFGQYYYSIWYGESHLAPIVIFSRETNANCEYQMDLTSEGEIELNWNEFLNFTLYELEDMLAAANVNWVIEPDDPHSPPTQFGNPFPAMRSAAGVIGGVEFGVEPQTNNLADQPYIATINKFDVRVDGVSVGLDLPDTGIAPTVVTTKPLPNQTLHSTEVTINGEAVDDGSGIDRVRIAIENLDYTFGVNGNDVNRWFNFNSGEFGDYAEAEATLSNTTDTETDWSITTTLPDLGNYRVFVLAVDSDGNQEYECCEGLWPYSTEFSIVASCNGLPVTVVLGNGDLPSADDDVIIGTSGPDLINSLSGNDTICAGEGSDVIDSGIGSDWVDAGSGNDMVNGRAGDDIVYGGFGDDVIVGGTGDDTIDGQQGDDTLYGQSGADLILGGAGIDGIFAGGGDDTINTGPGATVGAGVFVSGGSGNDVIQGGDDADDLRGVNGADQIFGGDGNDIITGGTGRDEIYGQSGNDVIRGQQSQDSLFGGEGVDYIHGGDEDDLVNGNDGDDALVGGSGNDQLNGGFGDDNLVGGGGDDHLLGEGGFDTCRIAFGVNQVNTCEILITE